MKTTRRLTAVALVLLLLLSLCGCIAEELPEEISRPETTRTTAATTLSTAPTTTATVTITDTTVVTTDATTATATQTATTVVTTQVTTKITVTATGSTAAPTTAAPQKPAIEWNVIKDKLPEDGITPGAAFPYGKVKGYCIDNPDKYVKEYQQRFGEIIESTAELYDLVWNTKEFQEAGDFYKPPVYGDEFFEENVLVEFMCLTRWDFRSSLIGSITLDGDTLHLHLVHEIYNVSMSIGAMRDVRLLVEMKREDAAKVKEIIVYQNEVLV